MQCSEKLRLVCASSRRMHGAICGIESAAADQGGVGVQIAETNGGAIIVNNLLQGGAAEETGKMSVGDTILSINGVSTESLTLDEVRERIVGDAGSPVTIELQQKGARKTRCCVTMFRGLRGGKDDVNSEMVPRPPRAPHPRHPAPQITHPLHPTQ